MFNKISYLICEVEDNKKICKKILRRCGQNPPLVNNYVYVCVRTVLLQQLKIHRAFMKNYRPSGNGLRPIIPYTETMTRNKCSLNSSKVMTIKTNNNNLDEKRAGWYSNIAFYLLNLKHNSERSLLLNHFHLHNSVFIQCRALSCFFYSDGIYLLNNLLKENESKYLYLNYSIAND